MYLVEGDTALTNCVCDVGEYFEQNLVPVNSLVHLSHIVRTVFCSTTRRGSFPLQTYSLHPILSTSCNCSYSHALVQNVTALL